MEINQSVTVESNDNISNLWPVKVSLYVKKTGKNSYYVKATISSRWSNYNNYGMVCKVGSNPSGHTYGKEWCRTKVNSWTSGQTVVAEGNITITGNTTIYGISKCAHCENTTPHSEKFNQRTPGVDLIYEADIIPDAPSIGIDYDDDSSFCWGKYNIWTYRGNQSFRFNVQGGNGTSKLFIELTRMLPDSQNWSTYTPNSNFNTEITATRLPSVPFYFSNGTRKYQYAIRAKSISSTGHSAWSGYHYFAVNDIPSIISLNSSTYSTSGAFTLSWSCDDQMNSGLWYELWYNANNSGWKLKTTYANTGTANLNIKDFISSGSCQFAIAPKDILETGNRSSAVTVSYKQENIIPDAPSISLRYDDDSSFCWGKYNIWTYKGNQNIYFNVQGGNGTSKLYLELTRMSPDSQNWSPYTPNSNFNTELSRTSLSNISFNFSSSTRKYQYAIRAKSISSTGHSAWSGYHYFAVNDLPSINSVRSSTYSTSGAFTLSWSTAADTFNNNLWYEVWYNANNSGWRLHQSYLNTTSASLNIKNFISSGSCQFAVTPKDILESGNRVTCSTPVSYVEDVIYPETPTCTLVTDSPFNSTSMYVSGFTTYKGDQSFKIKAVAGGKTSKIKIELQKRYVGGSWQPVVPNTDFNTSSSSSTIYATFYGGSTYRGYQYQYRAVATSSTGHNTSSSYKTFAINDIPTINSVSTNKSRTNNTFSLIWSTASDSFNSGSITYDIYKNYRNGGWQKISSGHTSTSASFDINDYVSSEGDSCLFAVRPKDAIEEGSITGNVSVSKNTKPYYLSTDKITSPTVSSSNSENVIGNSLLLTIPQGRDTDTTSGMTYRLECVKGTNTNGSWVNLGTFSNRTYSYDATNLPGGHVIKFRVKCIDDLGSVSDEYAYSQVFTKTTGHINSQCNSYIEGTSSDFLEGSTVIKAYESINRIRWDSVVDEAGVTCTYSVKLYEGNNAGVFIAKNISNNYISFSRTISRGTTFYFEILAHDSFNNTHSYGKRHDIGKTCRRNAIPSISLKPNTSSVRAFIYTDTGNPFVRIDLPTVTDIDSGQDKRFKIQAYVKNVKVKEFTTEWKNNWNNGFFSHSIRDIDADYTSIRYTMYCEDDLNMASNSLSTGEITVGTVPTDVQLVAPVSKIHSKKPRILLRMGKEDFNMDMHLIVTQNGKTYNSKDDSSLFNKSYYSSREYASFIPKYDLTPGNNTFKIASSTSLLESNAITITVTYEKEDVSKISNNTTKITSEYFNKLNVLTNNTLRAYNKEVSNIEFAKKDLIRYREISTLYNNLFNLNNYINTNFKGLSRNYTQTTLLKGSSISKNIPNTMIDIITNP